MNAYITDLASFLPNEPVANDRIEDVLGRINAIPSKSKAIMLRNNKIKQRYYALDPETGEFTHSNAQLTAEAVRRLNPYDGFKLDDIACLCCGTTSPDVLLPGHALMVLGELGLPPCDAVTTAGICIAGMTALKYAFMQVAAGLSPNAVATGSELSSSYLRADFFSVIADDPEADLAKKPILAFDADFLRWMLSDGAGAAFISGAKNPEGISLRIDWIDSLNRFPGSTPPRRENTAEAGWDWPFPNSYPSLWGVVSVVRANTAKGRPSGLPRYSANSPRFAIPG